MRNGARSWTVVCEREQEGEGSESEIVCSNQIRTLCEPSVCVQVIETFGKA